MNYQVIVGNIGMVYSGFDREKAIEKFNTYVKDSKENYGRAAGEPVALFSGEEIEMEYPGTLTQE